MAVQISWLIGFSRVTPVAPTATMPGWLGTVAEWNPVSATASATREPFGNPRCPGLTSTPSCWRWLRRCSSWPCSCPWPCAAGSG